MSTGMLARDDESAVQDAIAALEIAEELVPGAAFAALRDPALRRHVAARLPRAAACCFPSTTPTAESAATTTRSSTNWSPAATARSPPTTGPPRRFLHRRARRCSAGSAEPADKPVLHSLWCPVLSNRRARDRQSPQHRSAAGREDTASDETMSGRERAA